MATAFRVALSLNSRCEEERNLEWRANTRPNTLNFEIIMEHDLQIPAGFRPLDNQVAGHTFTDQSPSLGMLIQEDSGYVLKPLGKPECGKRELNFYETLQVNKDPTIIKLKTLVPKYVNKVKLIVNQREHIFIKLENLTHNMQRPCIVDVKIGRRTWDPLASPEKRSVEEQKYAKCKNSLGLCLPGFQLYSLNNDQSNNFIRYGKEYGKQLDEAGFCDTIALFLNSKHSICTPLVEEVLHQLYNIRSWFSNQTFYHFYASSILIAYDAAALTKEPYAFQNGYTTPENGAARTSKTYINNPNKTSSTPLNIRDFVKVRMIDFAHVFPAEGESPDSNYLFGLRNLITMLENLLQQ